jgi:uncharacterized YigZ family protein
LAFKTVSKPYEAELEEKGSRFIANLVPYDAFDNKLDVLRKLHGKASHHVTAFRVISDSNQIQENAKDDGEPAGTSGMPVLKTLIGANLINVGMIVTRYFGGTKLGTGGLARAYGGVSNLAIQKADLIEWKRIVNFTHQTSFEMSSEVERQIKLANLSVQDRQFNERGVLFALEGAEEDIEQFKQNIS